MQKQLAWCNPGSPDHAAALHHGANDVKKVSGTHAHSMWPHATQETTGSINFPHKLRGKSATAATSTDFSPVHSHTIMGPHPFFFPPTWWLADTSFYTSASELKSENRGLFEGKFKEEVINQSSNIWHNLTCFAIFPPNGFAKMNASISACNRRLSYIRLLGPCC